MTDTQRAGGGRSKGARDWGGYSFHATLMEKGEGREERKERGKKGREFMINNLSDKIMCSKMVEGIETAIKNFTPRERFNLYKIV